MRNRFDLESQRHVRTLVVQTALAILGEEVGLIEGVRRLSALAFDAVDDWCLDPDFRVIGALYSETDHLPVGAVRAEWDPTALVQKDAEIKTVEAAARHSIEQACRNLVSRFADV
jgi:Protein of unknown function (DUF2489)